ncbi:hypothetical protein [Streptomyces sp. LUP30]|uniref:hypothetical protein n=1 Tax=Streptomyces sp. LUP30 TaxID=1890285 RepID=UPI00085200CA|nr:hypothetical protein [Streptomyces sp. LUP30]
MDPRTRHGNPCPLQRVPEFRTLNIRHWDRIIDAWAARGNRAMDDAWIEQIVDSGPQPGRYKYCTNVGFAAWRGVV